jgi:beta-lactamase regulating signal transducer with metallopeptidase domain
MNAIGVVVASNAAVVLLLAVGVALLGRIWKNPIGLHLLWVLVLVKFVTPPIITVPVPVPADKSPLLSSATDRAVAVQPPAQPSPAATVAVNSAHKPNPRLGQESGVSESAQPACSVPPSIAAWHGIPWQTVLIWTWVAGGLTLAVGHAWRIAGFQRLLRVADVAPAEIQTMADRVGQQLGLRRIPAIRMLPVHLSPMVWSLVGRPRVFLPASLFARLNSEAQEAILAHELAHVRRKDHWVRLLELVVVTLFWWHPVAWWACRQLRELEEQCCDWLVLSTLPHGARSYALALVDTLDFLSEPSLRVPLGATAAGSCDSLARRITMLKDYAPTTRLSVARLALLLTLAAVPMTVAFAAVSPQPNDRATAPKPEAVASSAEGITYHCKIIDALTKRPVEGATVTVRRKVPSISVPFQKEVKLAETRHRTDADGQYAFTLPPEQVAEKHLYINIEVDQPNYVHHDEGWLFDAERPYYGTLYLWPAEQFVGTVVQPDGSPAAGVVVSGISKLPPDRLSATPVKAETDHDGVFRLRAILGGSTAFLLVPKDHSPSEYSVERDFTHLIKNGDTWTVSASLPAKHDIQKHRRNVGRFVLKDGIRLQGRVVDEAGRTVSGVWVTALDGKGEPFTLVRSALTDVDGRFDMPPLPPGKYRVMLRDTPLDPLANDFTPRPFSGVYPSQIVTLEEDSKTKEIQFRSVPTVTIVAQYYDSSGKPCSGRVVLLSGILDGKPYHNRRQPDPSGRCVFQTPKGLEDAHLEPAVSTHRCRVSKDAPLSNRYEVALGTLTHDLPDIAIIRYREPTLLVNAVDESGKRIEGFEGVIKYRPDRAPLPGGFLYKGKLISDAVFEPQGDGRWCSMGLLPDEEFTLTVQAPGYRSSSQKLSLPEGATKELDVKLQKLPLP